MALLGEHQKIGRVIPDRPFGDGRDGNATISSNPNTRTTFTGTSGNATGTAGNTSISNNDLVFIHQTQGATYGAWEINLVISGGGSTSLTFSVPLQNTYSTGAQIIKVPQYNEITINSHTVTAWDGSTGGVEVIAAKNATVASGQTVDGSSAGFRGGSANGNNQGNQGEGESGTGGGSTAANRNGGGAGGNWGAGGGGGSVEAGAASTQPGMPSPGAGGNVSGSSADGITLVLGGGGGAASFNNNTGGGGRGGGITVLFVQRLTMVGTITMEGTTAPNASGIVGGSGAGGMILVVCEIATLSTNLLKTPGGPPNTSANTGGEGGDGGIAVHHSGTVTGTTNPTFTDVFDGSLFEPTGAKAYSYFM